MDRVRAWLVAGVVGIAVGSATFVWLVGDLSLTIALVLVYTVGTKLFIEYAATLPGEIRGDDWPKTRWNAAFGGFMPFVGVLVMGVVPISFRLSIAFLLLVTGVGWTGLLFGVAMTRAQVAADESTEDAGTTSQTERGLV